jgi:hypothetical protein
MGLFLPLPPRGDSLLQLKTYNLKLIRQDTRGIRQEMPGTSRALVRPLIPLPLVLYPCLILRSMYVSGFALWSACDNERSEAAPLCILAVKQHRGGDWVADRIYGMFFFGQDDRIYRIG